ncbi:MAG: tetratricopeptide repeat protein [Elusimicrobiota bacterium]
MKMDKSKWLSDYVFKWFVFTIHLFTYSLIHLLFITYSLNHCLYAQVGSVNQYINQANELYSAGDVESAIISLEDALAFDPSSQQAKTLMIKILTEQGKKYYTQKNYPKALQYLKRASDLAPEIPELKTLYNEVQSAQQAAEIKPIEPIPQKEIKKIITSAPATSPRLPTLPTTPAQPQITKQELEKMVALLDTFKTAQAQWQQSTELLNKKIVKFEQARIMYLLVMIIAISIGLMGMGLYVVSRVKGTKRERLLLEHKNHLLNIIEQKGSGGRGGGGVSFAKDITKSVSDEEMSVKEMLVSPNAFIRARGVELLEEELKQQEDPVVSAKILLPYLRDPNNRVKANAAKAMYNINPDVAISTLADMLDSSNRWMQSSASWVLGEIGDTKSTEILINRFNVLDPQAKKSAVRSLHKILKHSQGKIADELYRKIEMIITGESAKKEGEITDIDEILKEIPGELKHDSADVRDYQAILHLKNGIVLYKDGKYNEAILELRDCIQYNDKIWQAYEFLGNCYYGKRKVQEAIKCYERALQLNPNATYIKDLIEQKKSELI